MREPVPERGGLSRGPTHHGQLHTHRGQWLGQHRHRPDLDQHRGRGGLLGDRGAGSAPQPRGVRLAPLHRRAAGRGRGCPGGHGRGPGHLRRRCLSVHHDPVCGLEQLLPCTAGVRTCWHRALGPDLPPRRYGRRARLGTDRHLHTGPDVHPPVPDPGPEPARTRVDYRHRSARGMAGGRHERGLHPARDGRCPVHPPGRQREPFGGLAVRQLPGL